MRITIEIDTTAPLTETDSKILSILAGGVSPVVEEAKVEETVAVEETKPAPAKRIRKAPAKKAEPVAEETPVVEETPVEAEEAEGPTLEDAVKLATEALGRGDHAKVKAALKASGGDRVRTLEGEQIAKFIEALNA